MNFMNTVLSLGLMSSISFAGTTNSTLVCEQKFDALRIECKSESCSLSRQISSGYESLDAENRLGSQVTTEHEADLSGIKSIQKSTSALKIEFMDGKKMTFKMTKDEEKGFLRLSVDSSIKGFSELVLKSIGFSSAEEMAYENCEIK